MSDGLLVEGCGRWTSLTLAKLVDGIGSSGMSWFLGSFIVMLMVGIGGCLDNCFSFNLSYADLIVYNIMIRRVMAATGLIIGK